MRSLVFIGSDGLGGFCGISFCGILRHISIGVALPTGTLMLLSPVAAEKVADWRQDVKVVHGVALKSGECMIRDRLALLIARRADDRNLNTREVSIQMGPLKRCQGSRSREGEDRVTFSRVPSVSAAHHSMFSLLPAKPLSAKAGGFLLWVSCNRSSKVLSRPLPWL